MVRLHAFVMVVVLVAAACGGSADAPPTTDSVVPSSSTSSTSPLPAYDPDAPWDTLFTAAPNPLTLSLAPDAETAVSAEIGSEGGILSATAADGTVFTLTIPANDLVMPVLITMTPTSSVGGFPDDATPQHALGVELEPDGLQLGLPATLTIAVADSLATHQVAAMDFATEGANAGFHYFTEESDTLTLSIDHFSGYVALYPVDDGKVRTLRRFVQAAAEASLRSEIAAILSTEAQRQKFGLPPNWDLRELAGNMLPVPTSGGSSVRRSKAPARSPLMRCTSLGMRVVTSSSTTLAATRRPTPESQSSRSPGSLGPPRPASHFPRNQPGSSSSSL